MNNSIASTITEQLATLPDDLQRQVLEFAQALKSSVRKGIAGKNLLRFIGFIPSDDLKKNAAGHRSRLRTGRRE